MSGFPLVGGLGASLPTTQKTGLSPTMSHHCFDPKMPIFKFSCCFWPFCPNRPPKPVEPIWEILHIHVLKKSKKTEISQTN